MLKLKTERECNLIINNVVKACKDIRKLYKTGYNFLYLASGFIAHYNLDGFIGYYERISTGDVCKIFGGALLKRDILAYQSQNQWANFRKGERDYEYYMQKKDIYNRICEKLKEG